MFQDKGIFACRGVYAKGVSILLRRSLKTASSLCKRRLVFTKTHQIFFSVHTSPQNAIIGHVTGHFGFLFEGNSGREITWRHRCRKDPFSKCFLSAQRRKAGVSIEFRRFEERFRIARFSWRISVDGRPNRGKSCVFKFLQSGVVWAGQTAIWRHFLGGEIIGHWNDHFLNLYLLFSSVPESSRVLAWQMLIVRAAKLG